MGAIKQEEYDFFKENGYLILGKLLGGDEVARFAEAFYRNRRDYGRFWNSNGICVKKTRVAIEIFDPGTMTEPVILWISTTLVPAPFILRIR